MNANIFMAAAIICVFGGVLSSIIMVAYVSQRGVKINWPLLRLFIFRYIGQYKRMTSEESGKAGPWYYCFVVSTSLALLFTVAGIILKTK